MSTFGSPGGRPSLSKPTPPQRGSFPLDHDGECTAQMKAYLACLKRARGVNEEECRGFSRAYLVCRMERGLMARDRMANLGFKEEEEGGVVDDGTGNGNGNGNGTGENGMQSGGGDAGSGGGSGKNGDGKNG